MDIDAGWDAVSLGRRLLSLMADWAVVWALRDRAWAHLMGGSDEQKASTPWWMGFSDGGKDGRLKP
jgi:hypothetical protein